MPRVGRFDALDESLPFALLAGQQRPGHGRCVVEVHPAVALWLWCREARDAAASWLYKRDRSVILVKDVDVPQMGRARVAKEVHFASSSRQSDAMNLQSGDNVCEQLCEPFLGIFLAL